MKPQPSLCRRLFILFSLTLVACGGARAQVSNTQTQTPATTIQTPAPSTVQPGAQPASETMRLNVIVSDESNRVVADLRREDFRVEEDGVPQTLTHFAREAAPVSYTLVVDNSGSLRSVLDNILRACATLVSANQPADETSVTRFVGSDQITVVEDFTDGQAALMKGLSGMYVEGGQTAVVDAVYLSALRVAERRTDEVGRRRALVLLTDGEDRSSYYRPSELEKLLRKLDVQVFVIGIVSILDRNEGIISKSPRDKATAFLNSLARETGGRAFFPKNVKEMQEAVNEIARDLRTQYAISYQTSNPNRDGKFRKVQVKLSEATAGGKRTVHTRSGYFAPGGKDEGKKESKEKSPRPKSP